MHITNSIKVRKELQFALLSPNLSLIFEDTGSPSLLHLSLAI